MGTKSEIYIRDGDGKETIELWQHFEGYKEYMVPFFRNFVKWMAKRVGNNKHWLTYPTEVAGSLIAYDYEKNKEEIEKEIKAREKINLRRIIPDIKPKGNNREADYAWILQTASMNSEPYFRLIGYKLGDYEGLCETEVIAASRGEKLENHIKICDKELKL